MNSSRNRVTGKPELSVTIIIVIINHIATQDLSVQIQEFDAFLFHCHGLRPGAGGDDLREGGSVALGGMMNDPGGVLNGNHEILDDWKATYTRICWGHTDNSLCEYLRIFAIRCDPKSGRSFGPGESSRFSLDGADRGAE
jgi:hypothetical protein